jgi:hypothetical protein
VLESGCGWGFAYAFVRGTDAAQRAFQVGRHGGLYETGGVGQGFGAGKLDYRPEVQTYPLA